MIERDNQLEKSLPQLLGQLENSKRLDLPAKGILYEQETKAKNIYIVEKGKVYTQKIEKGYDRALVDKVATPGDILGIEALLEENYYEGTACAAVDSQVVGIEKYMLLHAAQEDPALTLSLFKVLAKDISKRDEHFYNIRDAKAEVKKEKKLKNIHNAAREFADEEGNLTVTQKVLAGRVGLQRSDFTKRLLKVDVHLRKGATIPDFPKIK